MSKIFRHGLFPTLVLLAATACGLDADRISTRRIERMDEDARAVTMTAATAISGSCTVSGTAAFVDGIEYLAPAPGLGMDVQVPAWWRTYGVLDAGAEPNDFAAATQGQVKTLARKAVTAFLAAGLGTPDLWASYLVPYTSSNNALPVCLGQLKQAARPFWIRLGIAGTVDAFPWTGDVSEDDALVNVGQVKRAFAFEIPRATASVPVELGDDPLQDSDGDGLADIEETGGIVVYDRLPWLDFDTAEDLTETFTGGLALWTLPEPLRILDVQVTNVVLDAHGVLRFPRTDHPGNWKGLFPLSIPGAADYNVLYFAAFGGPIRIDTERTPPTCIRAGQATHEGVRYLLFEYANMYWGESIYKTEQKISFQLALPVGSPDRAYIRYRGVDGDRLNGEDVYVGFSGMHGRVEAAYCKREAGRITEGLALCTFFGKETNPRLADTDGDGLLDAEELAGGTNPARFDTDGDGIPDGWELANDLCPTDPTDARRDADWDGLNNLGEYLNNSNMRHWDTDGDGVWDSYEVNRKSDVLRRDDGGEPAPADRLRTVTFQIGGDYATWELTVTGIGPDDTRTQRVTMTRPNTPVSATFQLRKRNAYRITMRWLNCTGHEDGTWAPWYCWRLGINEQPAVSTYEMVDNVARRNGEVPVIFGEGWVVDNAEGLFSAHTCSCREYGGNVAQGLSAMLYILGDPELVFDYNRDGAIGDDDFARAQSEERTFRFWSNDDADSGDVCRSDRYLSDAPGDSGNADDKVVNGRRDLVDFTPVLINLRNVFPPNMPRAFRKVISWKLTGSGNALWTRLWKNEVGTFQRQDVAECGEALDQMAYEASVTRLTTGASIPAAFSDLLTERAQGVFFLEGVKGKGLRLAGEGPKGKTIVSAEADLCVSSVEEMYRWMNLRNLAVTNVSDAWLAEPPNRPDGTCDGRNYVFVHGFNVNEKEAHAAGAEMFKRLWQSGLRSMFTVVDWQGDDRQYDSFLTDAAFDGPICPNYYANVVHAFQAAPGLAARSAALPGEKVFIAHSLGNMLVSSAAVDHGLAYERYYMLNAAVAQEAYDGKSHTSTMVDRHWFCVPEAYRASGWSGLFATNDFRSTLSWKGRFAGLRRAINLYSPTDEILANARKGDLMLEGSVWKIQEMSKGAAVWHALNALTVGRDRISCEGGWGVNTFYALNPHYYLAGFLPSAAKLSREDVIRHPLFTPFRTESTNMHDVARFTVEDPVVRAELRAKFLADAIPAESHAAGANQVGGMTSRSMLTYMNGSRVWPANRSKTEVHEWWHSDIKNLAYFFVCPLFDRMISDKWE